MAGHLIHIGYPKSGSTFLQKWFQQHPQLFYSPGGLGGFYNVYEISRRASQMADEEFMYYVTSDESLSIPKISTGKMPVELAKRDFTIPESASIAQRKVCNTLKSLYPNGRILFITRGFKGFMMSGYSQYIKAGGVLSFQQLNQAHRAAMTEKAAKASYGEEVDYTYIANLYEEAFGKENVIILPFELLRDDQHTFLSTIEERLGLSHATAQIGKVNESLSPEELYWYPRISSVVSRIAHRFGEKGNTRIYSWYIHQTLRNKFRSFIKILDLIKSGRTVKDADLPFEMLDYFRENNTDRFAAKFRTNPMYIPYLSDYLLDT